MKTLIQGGYVVDPFLPFKKTDILIEDQIIIEMTSGPKVQPDRIIDASGKIILPGLISSHSHAYTLLLRGLTDNLPLEPWLFYHMHAGMGKFDFRDLALSSALGGIELLRSGTTSLIEHGPAMGSLAHFSECVNAVAKGLSGVGIRAVVAPSYCDINYSERIPLSLLPEIDPQLKRVLDPFDLPKSKEIIPVLRQILHSWRDRDPLIHLDLGPANPDACTSELMEKTAELASEFKIGIHTHLLESRCMKVFCPSVVKRLSEMNWLGPHVSFAHGVWLDEKDIHRLAETHSTVVHNPIGNLKLGDGIAPLQTMKSCGLNVALGVDNAGGANDSQNMFEVMKATALVHKLYGTPARWINAQDAFSMCLTNGAKALRQKVGTLQPGYLADLVILGTERLFMNSKETIINQLVYTDLGSSVETVMVGGRVVIEERRLQTANEADLYAEAKERVEKIYRDIAPLNNRLAPALGLLDRMCSAADNSPLPFSRKADL